jgi:hypothetical protein
MPVGGERMKVLETTRGRHLLRACHGISVYKYDGQSTHKALKLGARGRILLSLVIVILTNQPLTARSQTLIATGGSPAEATTTATRQPDETYIRPTQRTKVKNYLFDTYGPYPAAVAAVGAGINQWTNAPPEWGQGADGYAKRFGSNYGIAIVATTTRYGLSEAFKEDAMYYRCECSGFFPRLRHALISTLTARRGEDGHRVFSIPALVGPYAGTMTATYGWYPSRYGAKDAFRTGNYSLLTYAGGNVALEFLYSGPHSLLSRMHLNNAHGSPEPGPNH